MEFKVGDYVIIADNVYNKQDSFYLEVLGYPILSIHYVTAIQTNSIRVGTRAFSKERFELFPLANHPLWKALTILKEDI